MHPKWPFPTKAGWERAAVQGRPVLSSIVFNLEICHKVKPDKYTPTLTCQSYSKKLAVLHQIGGGGGGGTTTSQYPILKIRWVVGSHLVAVECGWPAAGWPSPIAVLRPQPIYSNKLRIWIHELIQSIINLASDPQELIHTYGSWRIWADVSCRDGKGGEAPGEQINPSWQWRN